MAFIHLGGLPHRCTTAQLAQWVAREGRLRARQVGRVVLTRRRARVEVDDDVAVRLAKALDGCVLDGACVEAWAETGEGARTAHPHLRRLLSMLELESRAELDQVLADQRLAAAAGGVDTSVSLSGLVVVDSQVGLGGRLFVRLAKRGGKARLPPTRFGVGSPVLLARSDSTGRPCRAVVSEITSEAVHVALPESSAAPDGDSGYMLGPAQDEVARDREREALSRAMHASGDRLAQLRDLILSGDTPPGFADVPGVSFLDPGLNAAQREAVCFALSAKDVAAIHGPPGTGKTRAVVELIRQETRRGRRVLACAPSNLAVDNVFARLLAHGEGAVRIGHPARVQEDLRAHSLDGIVDAHPDLRATRKLSREVQLLFAKSRKAGRDPGAAREREQLRFEAKEILDDIRRIEEQVVEGVLDGATVVCATLTGLDSEVLGSRRFDVVVIDEACQCTEPACWIPLQRCDRVVLAGDHCQLPPTVLSMQAQRKGFAVSLLERLVKAYGAGISRQLVVQYRMHADIMAFSSAEFYRGTLEADPSVAGHLLSGLPDVRTGDELGDTPVQFIDTSGALYDEEQEPGGESKRNPDEARLVCKKVDDLLALGLSPARIAVITPYAAQVRLIRETLGQDGVEVATVDGFQGRENEAVVISLVRSNRDREIGFLCDFRRMNVALTRARRKLIVIGDSSTISVEPFYERLLDHFDHIGAYYTVWDEE